MHPCEAALHLYFYPTIFMLISAHAVIGCTFGFWRNLFGIGKWA